MGVWDTVSSVIVPRPDRLYLPSLQELPYTKTNSYIEVFRHAIAIDERRRMFRINRWTEPQTYKPNPFSTREAPAQDIKQVWFAGVHSDIGGGYSETKSGAAKYPLRWMIDEAVVHGLEISKSMYDHLVLGHPLPGGRRAYTAPDFTAKLHNSMNWAWSLLEGIPKRTTRRDWPQRQSVLGWYLPLCEPRRIDDGALVHHSVFDRVNADPNYRPVNLPPTDRVRIEGSAGKDARQQTEAARRAEEERQQAEAVRQAEAERFNKGESREYPGLSISELLDAETTRSHQEFGPLP
jgi:uncharacterized protein (DUF2235 family)